MTQEHPEYGKIMLTTPPQASGTVTLHDPKRDVAVQMNDTEDGPVNVYWDGEDEPTPPPTPGEGRYGDGWPQIPANAIDYTSQIRSGGNNNKVFPTQGAKVVGKTFKKKDNLGCVLTDCTGGTVYFIDCKFHESRQGCVVRMTHGREKSCDVRFIRCKFLDNWVEGNTALPAELGCFVQSKAGPAFFGWYGCTFINNGWDGKHEKQDWDPSVYDHSTYPKGEVEIEELDCVHVRPSAQANKGVTRSFVCKRNVVLEPAIGYGAGTEEEGTDRSDEDLAMAHFEGNVIYGARDLENNNQRLGWGFVAQGVRATYARNIICSPNSRSQNLPAFRFNAVDNTTPDVQIVDNIILGYKHVIELDGKDTDFRPHIYVVGNACSTGTVGYKLRNDASSINIQMEDNPDHDVTVKLDVDDIETKLRADQITSADIIKMVKEQL